MQSQSRWSSSLPAIRIPIVTLVHVPCKPIRIRFCASAAVPPLPVLASAGVSPLARPFITYSVHFPCQSRPPSLPMNSSAAANDAFGRLQGSHSADQTLHTSLRAASGPAISKSPGPSSILVRSICVIPVSCFHLQTGTALLVVDSER